VYGETDERREMIGGRVSVGMLIGCNTVQQREDVDLGVDSSRWYTQNKRARTHAHDAHTCKHARKNARTHARARARTHA